MDNPNETGSTDEDTADRASTSSPADFVNVNPLPPHSTSPSKDTPPQSPLKSPSKDSATASNHPYLVAVDIIIPDERSSEEGKDVSSKPEISSEPVLIKETADLDCMEANSNPLVNQLQDSAVGIPPSTQTITIEKEKQKVKQKVRPASTFVESSAAKDSQKVMRAMDDMQLTKSVDVNHLRLNFESSQGMGSNCPGTVPQSKDSQKVTRAKDDMQPTGSVGINRLRLNFESSQASPPSPCLESHTVIQPPSPSLESRTATQLPSPCLESHTATHFKRLRSGKCREDWILPTKVRKKSPIPEEEEADEGGLTMVQLVTDYSKQFPLRVKVVRGLKEQITAKSILNIHFLKQTNVVDISDSINQRYLVPYNSSAKFGLVYCPGVKNECYYFEKVSDIIQSDDMPKVVTCTKKAKNRSNSDANISPNEVLIVVEVIISKGQIKPFKKTKLKVFSFTEKKEKILPSDMIGKFTTDPKLAQFNIPDIMKYIPDPFPATARLFLKTGTTPLLPDLLTKETVLILDSTVETSLIASLSDDTESEYSISGITKNTIEVPINGDILIEVIDEDKKSRKMEALYADTHALWQNFMNPPDKNTIHPKLASSGMNLVQHKLFSQIREGAEREGLAIEPPPLMRESLPINIDKPNKRIYQVLLDTGLQGKSEYMPLLSVSSSVSSENRSSLADDAEFVDKDTVEDLDPFTSDTEIEISERKMKPPSGQDSYDSNDALQNIHRLIRRIEALEMRITSAAPQNTVHRLTRRVEALESRLSNSPLVKKTTLVNKTSETEKELRLEVKALGASFKTLELEVKDMRKEFTEALKKMQKEPAMVAQKQQIPEENITALKEMTSTEVGKLLKVLKLEEYFNVFMEESITGEILAECSEEVLIHDLGMKNPKHCSTLMKVINGHYPVQALLAAEDGAYVRFESLV